MGHSSRSHVGTAGAGLLPGALGGHRPRDHFRQARDRAFRPGGGDGDAGAAGRRCRRRHGRRAIRAGRLRRLGGRWRDRGHVRGDQPAAHIGTGALGDGVHHDARGRHRRPGSDAAPVGHDRAGVGQRPHAGPRGAGARGRSPAADMVAPVGTAVGDPERRGHAAAMGSRGRPAARVHLRAGPHFVCGARERQHDRPEVGTCRGGAHAARPVRRAPRG